MSRQARDGKPSFEPPYRLLAVGHARFVGDCVAAVVAETQAQAEDADELVAIEWETLPAVTEAVYARLPKADVSRRFEELIADKAKHLGITLKQMEAKLRAGDATLMSALLATPVGLMAFQEWQGQSDKGD